MKESSGKRADVTSLDKDGTVHRVSELPEIPTKAHEKCSRMVGKACKSGAYITYVLKSLRKLGCDTGVEEGNIVCEPCSPELYTLFDTDRKEVVVCEDRLFGQRFLNNVVTHSLIIAYDVCRTKFDKTNIRHLACTSIRVANLTGDCFFWKHNFLRLSFGWKAHQKKCVRDLAVRNMMSSKSMDEKTAKEAVDSVFDACYGDTEPFPRIPP